MLTHALFKRNLLGHTSLSRTVRVLATAAALATVAACSDTTSPYGASVGGSYSLQTVNGNNLPYTYTSGGQTVSIQSDIYTLNNDGTYNETISELVSTGGGYTQTSDAEAGTWNQNGTAAVFTPTYSTQNNYGQYTGSINTASTFSHSTITFSYNGIVWVYSHT
ncbi:MAG: hypothetical protein M3R65_10470 [Gemmatimonadota bacterium]|nr:hypothetical protein [Gemmatimonadota bacterium]